MTYTDSLLSLGGSLALLKEVETPVSLMWWSASPLGNFLMNSGDESCRQVCKSALIYKASNPSNRLRKLNSKIATIA